MSFDTDEAGRNDGVNYCVSWRHTSLLFANKFWKPATITLSLTIKKLDKSSSEIIWNSSGNKSEL
jgi:hypothetical protein